MCIWASRGEGRECEEYPDSAVPPSQLQKGNGGGLIAENVQMAVATLPPPLPHPTPMSPGLFGEEHWGQTVIKNTEVLSKILGRQERELGEGTQETILFDIVVVTWNGSDVQRNI